MKLRIDIQLYFELLAECPYTDEAQVDLEHFYQWLDNTWNAVCTRPSNNDTDPLLGWELTFKDYKRLALFQVKYASYHFAKVA